MHVSCYQRAILYDTLGIKEQEKMLGIKLHPWLCYVSTSHLKTCIITFVCVAKVAPFAFFKMVTGESHNGSVISNDISHNGCYLRCLNN